MRHQRANKTHLDKPQVSRFSPVRVWLGSLPVSPAPGTEPAARGQAQAFVDTLKEDGNLQVREEIKEQLKVLPEDPSLGWQGGSWG